MHFLITAYRLQSTSVVHEKSDILSYNTSIYWLSSSGHNTVEKWSSPSPCTLPSRNLPVIRGPSGVIYVDCLLGVCCVVILLFSIPEKRKEKKKMLPLLWDNCFVANAVSWLPNLVMWTLTLSFLGKPSAVWPTSIFPWTLKLWVNQKFYSHTWILLPYLGTRQ